MLTPWKESYDQSRQHIKKQRHYFANKGPSSQGYGFSSGHVWMWELDCKESWGLKNWCFWTVVLEKTLESPLDYKEIQQVHPKGAQSWVFIGRTNVEAETPILWPPHVKSWLIGKAPDAGKDWGQEEKGTTEDEMVGWHHWLHGHGSGWTPGVGDGQGGLACCGSWGCKESDVTEWLNWTEPKRGGMEHMNISYQGKKNVVSESSRIGYNSRSRQVHFMWFCKSFLFFFLLSLIFIFYKREKWHGYCEAENKWYLYSVCHTWISLVWWLSGKEPTCQCRRHGINPWSEKIPHTAGQFSLSHLFTNTGTTLACTRQTFVSRVMSLLFNTLSRPFIAILPRSKHLGDWEKSIYTFLWLTHESF